MKQAITPDLKPTLPNGTPLTHNATTVIREVYSCLVPCSQCTGVYTDSISGTMIRIICKHECHKYVASKSSKQPGMLTPAKVAHPGQSTAILTTPAHEVIGSDATW